MTDSRNSQSLEARIAQTLDARSEALDPDLRRRLDGARRQALAERRNRPGAIWAWPALATAGAAAALVAAIALQTETSSPPSAPQTADLDLLTREDFELITEDPEFFAWIAAQSESSDDASDDEERSG